MSISNLGDLMRSSRDQRASTEQVYKDLFEGILSTLKDDDKEVRAAAAKALGSLGDRDAIEPLQEALKDDESEVRKAAVEALGEIAKAIAKSGKMESPNRLI